MPQAKLEVRDFDLQTGEQIAAWSAVIMLCSVAVLAIDKVGPMLYHFRSGPTSGPTTRPGSQKSKMFVVNSLAVLKGHPECLKCG